MRSQPTRDGLILGMATKRDPWEPRRVQRSSYRSTRHYKLKTPEKVISDHHGNDNHKETVLSQSALRKNGGSKRIRQHFSDDDENVIIKDKKRCKIQTIPPTSNHDQLKDQIDNPKTTKQRMSKNTSNKSKCTRTRKGSTKTIDKDLSASVQVIPTNVDSDDLAASQVKQLLWQPQDIIRKHEDLCELDLCLSFYIQTINNEITKHETDQIIQNVLRSHSDRTRQDLVSYIRMVHMIQALCERIKREQEKHEELLDSIKQTLTKFRDEAIKYASRKKQKR